MIQDCAAKLQDCAVMRLLQSLVISSGHQYCVLRQLDLQRTSSDSWTAVQGSHGGSRGPVRVLPFAATLGGAALRKTHKAYQPTHAARC